MQRDGGLEAQGMTTHSKFYIKHTNDFFSFPLSKSLISILYIERTNEKIEHANELRAANNLHIVIGFWKRILLSNSSPSSQKQVTLDWQGRSTSSVYWLIARANQTSK